MPIPDRPGTKHTGRIKKNSFLPIVLVSLVLAAGIAGVWFYFSPSPPSPTPVPSLTTPQPSPAPPSRPLQSPPTRTVPAVPVQPEEDSSVTGQPAVPPPEIQDNDKVAAETVVEKVDQLEPETPPLPPPSPQQLQCRQLADRLHAFFTHLDSREYIQEFQLGVPAQDYFLALITKLLNKPPVVSRESDDLYTILKNMAHFFRVIGGKNIIIIKTILDRERDTIEDVAADLFQWTTGKECTSDVFSFRAPVDKLYEYAGFFLNSMGGRSYLFRRDSRSRLLINYYAIMLIDRANTKGINRHGIDIKPLLPVIISEIEGSNQLIYKEKYLDSLYELIEKYQ